MPSLFFPLAVAAALAAPGLEHGTLLTYRGTMLPVKDDGGPAKQFDLAAVALELGDETVHLGWTTREQSRGGWSWLDRFGRYELHPARRGDAAQAPSLLYQREDGRSVVPLPPVLFAAPVPLARGAMWTEGRLEYRVVGESEKAKVPCWEIEVRSPFGHKRTLHVDRERPVVVAVKEVVFLGQGVQHELKLELVERQTLSADDQAHAVAAFDAGLKLREALGRQPRTERAELNDAQLAQLRAAAPQLVEAAAGTILAPVAAAAQEDVREQRGRSGAVAALRTEIVGRPLGEFQLEELAGKTVSAADWKDKVVVLHFWEYRDAPLEEPYGQTGYLDFLHRKRGGEGVLVAGVNVDPRLARDDTKRASIAAAKRLKSFMNLSYPVLLDSGDALKRLGDPRTVGGKLPVFVVIGRDGKVAAYHAGLYEVRADRGLEELDAAVTAALSAGK